MKKGPLLFVQLGSAGLAVCAFIAISANRNEDRDSAETESLGASGSGIIRATTPAARESLPKNRAPLALTETERRLRSALAGSNSEEISEIFAQVTPENAAAMLAILEEVASSRDIRSSLDLFIVAWARVDGPSAVAYALQQPEGITGYNGLLAKAASGWAEIDPNAAMKAMNDGEIPERYYSNILDGLMVNDLDAALSVTAGLEPEFRKFRTLCMGNTLQDDPVGMLKWVDSALNVEDPDPVYVEQVLDRAKWMTDGRAFAGWLDRNSDSPFLTSEEFGMAARSWVKTDPEAAIDWITARAGDERFDKSVLVNLMHGWAESDPAATVDWIVKNPDHPLMSPSSLHVAIMDFAKREPRAAADWVEENMDGQMMTRQVAGNVTREWVAKAPDDALRWAESLPADMQGESFYHLAYGWPANRLDEFDAWLSEAGRESQFDGARERLLGRIFERDSIRALEIVNELTDPARIERATIKVVQTVIQQNPEIVQAWLPTSGLSDRAQQKILAKDLASEE